MASITDPGNANDVITVGSTHRFEPHGYGVSYFSSRGPTGDGRAKPDLVAPGEKVTAPAPGNTEIELDGTSGAAPHVSGAAALLLCRYPELRGRPAEESSGSSAPPRPTSAATATPRAPAWWTSCGRWNRSESPATRKAPDHDAPDPRSPRRRRRRLPAPPPRDRGQAGPRPDRRRRDQGVRQHARAAPRGAAQAPPPRLDGALAIRAGGADPRRRRPRRRLRGADQEAARRQDQQHAAAVADPPAVDERLRRRAEEPRGRPDPVGRGERAHRGPGHGRQRAAGPEPARQRDPARDPHQRRLQEDPLRGARR